MKKPLLLDIMLNDKFVCQLEYTKRGFQELIDGEIKESHKIEDLEAFVYSQRPSLRGKNFKIEFSNKKV